MKNYVFKTADVYTAQGKTYDMYYINRCGMWYLLFDLKNCKNIKSNRGNDKRLLVLQV